MVVEDCMHDRASKRRTEEQRERQRGERQAGRGRENERGRGVWAVRRGSSFNVTREKG